MFEQIYSFCYTIGQWFKMFVNTINVSRYLNKCHVKICQYVIKQTSNPKENDGK